MVVNHKINMDLAKPAVMPRVDMVQKDQYTRQLELSLYANDEPWVIPEDVSVLISFLRSDGSGGDYDSLESGVPAWSASENVLTVGIAPPLLADPGPVMLAVDLIQGTNKVSTFNIMLYVQETVSGAYDSIVSGYRVDAFLPMPDTAEVGQYIRVSKVDEKGKVRAVAAVNLSGGTSESGVWGTVYAQSVNITQKLITDGGITVSFNNNRLQGVSTPVDEKDAANKLYVDQAVDKCWLPEYWQEAADAACEKINALQDAGGKNCVSFAWFSDSHVCQDSSVPNAGYTGKLAGSVMDACHIPFALMCGDAARSDGNGLTSEGDMRASLAAAEQIFSPIGWDRLLQVQGNHDGSWGTNTALSDPYYCYQMDGNVLYSAIFRKQTQDTRRCFGGDGSYYYVDYPAAKLRFVMLNSLWVEDETDEDGVALHRRMRTYGYGNQQLNWLAGEALRFEEDGWALVLATHVPPISAYDSLTRDETVLRGILAAFASGGSYSGTSGTAGEWDYVSVSCDFSSACLGEIVGFFCGHVHKDQIITGELPYPLITITSDADLSYDENEETRVLGTANEHALDFVTVNRDTKVVSLTRLGAGADRMYSYGSEAWVLHSITKKLSNCTLDNSADTVKSGESYTASVTAGTGYTLNSLSVTMGGTDITDDCCSGGVIQIDSVTGDIVITAKASADSEYTNLADPASEDWANDSRLNSSASVVSCSGGCVTNWIDCSAGDVIRISGLNILDSTAGYMAFIKVDGTGYEATKCASYPDHFTQTDGVIAYTIYSIVSSATENWQGKIRFSGALTADSAENIVITVNQEI